MAVKPNYIVFAPSYDANSGGAIFLHELANALKKLGENAFIWPANRPISPGFADRVRRVWRRPSTLWKEPRFEVGPGLAAPIAQIGDLTDRSIVVYPEVTLGNPLGAKNVVRWLLYRPGLRDPYEFGENEMFFRAGEMSDLPSVTGGATDLYLWKIHPAYRNENRPDRSGACYIVRKGEAKRRIPQTANAVRIDGMSHTEIADVFNRCDTFYSYDEATFYSQYAAICGCTSVIVPGLYSSREEWVKNHGIGRYGVAYGLDDLDHARATRHKVIGLLHDQEAKGLETVKSFVAATRARFAKA